MATNNERIPPMVHLSSRLLGAFLRKLFYMLYHQFAWTYDGVSALVSLGMWQEWIAAPLTYLHGPRLLELGPGPGHVQRQLMERGVQAVGLEASPQMAHLAYYRNRNEKENAKIVNGYAQFIPFPTAFFQQVLATFPTDYIFQQETILEIARVLVPGGECIVLPAAWITSNALPFCWAARLFEITGQAPEWLPDWAGPFTRCGFSVELIPIELPRSRLVLIHARKGPHIHEE